MTPVAGPHSRRSATLSLSDEQLRQQVLGRLAQFGPRISRDVVAKVRGGNVVLAGAVDSDYERQVIGQTIERISGIVTLDNLLDLRSSEPAPSHSVIASVLPRPSRRAVIGAMAAACLMIGGIGWQIAASQTASAAVVGTVRVAGEPATGAILTLHPLSSRDTAISPQARVDEAGNIQWTTHASGDIPAGEYAVTVVWPRVEVQGTACRDMDVLAAAYGTVESSPLRLQVDPAAKCRIVFELSRSR